MSFVIFRIKPIMCGKGFVTSLRINLDIINSLLIIFLFWFAFPAPYILYVMEQWTVSLLRRSPKSFFVDPMNNMYLKS